MANNNLPPAPPPAEPPTAGAPPPPPLAPQPPRNVGRGATSNYSTSELEGFLSILEDVLPIGPDEWDEVAGRHAEDFPGRDTDALRREYNTLHRKKCPTGNPNIPFDIRAAK